MYRADKDKQQLIIEIDSITSSLDSANKAKVCQAFLQFAPHISTFASSDMC